MRALCRIIALAAACGALAAPGACRRADAPAVATERSTPPATAPAAPPAARAETNAPRHDLSIDESMGGHTLARHVGRTDAELARRLQREQISAASTYSDRDAAERAVGAALQQGGRKLTAWQERSGRRPNLVLHYVDRAGAPLGRTLFRGENGAVPCDRALVVLRWDEAASRSFVLTSYPDCNR